MLSTGWFKEQNLSFFDNEKCFCHNQTKSISVKPNMALNALSKENTLHLKTHNHSQQQIYCLKISIWP